MSYAGLPVSPDSDLQRALQISAAEARAGSAAERGKPKITDEQRLASDEAERLRQKEIKTFVNQGSREWESDADKAARLAAANALESRLNSKAGQGKLPGQQAVVSAKAEKSFDLAFAVQEKKFQQFAAQRDEVFGSERKAAPQSPLNVLVSPAALGYSSSDDVSMWAPIPALESALQLIHSKNAADVSASSLQTIRTVLENIVKAATPEEVSKFRRIKYNSKIVQKNISQVVGALQCVQVIFTLLNTLLVMYFYSQFSFVTRQSASSLRSFQLAVNQKPI
jgi:hypothetical protein